LDYPHDKIEVIIVKDFNDKEAEDVIRKFLQEYSEAYVRVINITENVVTKAHNIGIRECKGQVVFTIPDDVLIHPQTVKRAIELLYENDRIAAVTFPAIPEYSHNIPLHYRLHHMRFLGIISVVNAVLLFTAYKKNVFTKVGLYREDMGLPLSIHEDWELGSRIRKHGFKVLVDGTLPQIHLEATKESNIDANKAVKKSKLIRSISGIRNYVKSYITKHYWSVVQVLKVSPKAQILEYIAYTLLPVIIITMISENILLGSIFLITLLLYIDAYYLIKGYYSIFRLYERLLYPLLLTIVRIFRTYLVLLGISYNKVFKRLRQ
jgi:glycosyltransferase involved in cell wall biosynthesis